MADPARQSSDAVLSYRIDSEEPVGQTEKRFEMLSRRKPAETKTPSKSGANRLGSTPEARGPVVRKSTRLAGKTVDDAVLRTSPVKIPAPKKRSVRKEGEEPREDRDVKRARLLAELDQLNQEEEKPRSESDGKGVGPLDDTRSPPKEPKSPRHRSTPPSLKARPRRPKLEKPGPFGGEKGKYRGWARVTKMWASTHDDVSDSDLGGLLLQSMQGDAEDIVIGSLDDEELGSFKAIMAVLETSFGQEELLESIAAEAELKACVRKGEDLATFLAKYEAARRKAIRHGYRSSELTAGTDLLKAAKVSSAAKSSVLQALSSKAEGDKQDKVGYDDVVRLLRAQARSDNLVDDGEEGVPKSFAKKERKALLAQGRAEGWSASKGGGKGKSAGKDKGGSQGKGGAAGQWKGPKGVCWYHLQNRCTRGEKCTFPHTGGGQPVKNEHHAAKGYQKGGKNNKGSGKGAQWREGDWQCPSCNDHQFAQNTECRKCGTKKVKKE